MEFSKKFRILLVVLLVLSIANLLLINDIMHVWDGAEATLLWDALHGSGAHFWPKGIIAAMGIDDDSFPFMQRLPSVLLFMTALASFLGMGIQAFGNRLSLMTVFTALATFSLLAIAKVATGDIYVFFFQVLAVMSLIRFLKAPSLVWRIFFYISTLGAISAHPVSSSILLLGFSAFLHWRHVQGKNIWKLQAYVAVAVALAAVFVVHPSGWWKGYSYFGFPEGNYLKFLLWSLVGLLPFTGFLLGGLRDIVYKIRKGEEMATIIGALILFGFLGQSFWFVLGLVMLIARQFDAYAHPNYPFRGWVRTGAVLHLLGAFVVCIVLMLRGITEFGGTGFRMGMLFSIAYWSLGVFSMVGLISNEPKKHWSWYTGGILLSSTLSIFILLMTIVPLLESKVQLSDQMNERLSTLTTNFPNKNIVIYNGELSSFPGLAAELAARNNQVSYQYSDANNASSSQAINIMPIQESDYAHLNADSLNTFKSWRTYFNEEYWLILDADTTLEK